MVPVRRQQEPLEGPMSFVATIRLPFNSIQSARRQSYPKVLRNKFKTVLFDLRCSPSATKAM